MAEEASAGESDEHFDPVSNLSAMRVRIINMQHGISHSSFSFFSEPC